jgi:hypothetical protein
MPQRRSIRRIVRNRVARQVAAEQQLPRGRQKSRDSASSVKFLVVFALYLAVGLGWNHGNFARLLPGDQDPLVGVEALVGEQNVSVQLGQQYTAPSRSQASPRVR